MQPPHEKTEHVQEATEAETATPQTAALKTSDLEMGDVEKYHRSFQEDHRRLNRRHKPPITAARHTELRSIQDRFVELQEVRQLLRADIVKAQEAEQPTTTLDSALKTLDKEIQEHTLSDYDAIQLRLADRFGLLSLQDLERLESAEDKRWRRESKMIERLARGEFRQ